MASEPENPLASGVTADLYKAAIGPHGQDYYLRQFLKFDAAGKTSISWHWPACCATLSWLVFRKMWRWALAYGALLLGLALLIFGVGKLAFDYSESTGLLLLSLFLSAAFVLPGLYANAWYYSFCTEKMSAALRDSATVKEACEALASRASTRRRWLGLVAANGVLLVLLASIVTLVLRVGQEGLRLVQMKPVPATQPVVNDLTVAVSPLAAASSAASAASAPVEAEPPQPAASQPAAAAAVPIEVAPPEPVQLAASAVATPPSADPVAQPKAEQASKQKHKATTAPEAKGGHAKRPWLVQVGAFAKEENVKNVQARLEATGLPSTADTSEKSPGRLIRVRVGPFDSKAEAQKAALQIKALDLPAVLVRP